MLSFGIRFGQGFDRLTLMKLMQSEPVVSDYDVVVIGASPGGVAYAREAGLAGKKTALVKCKRLTPAEEETLNEEVENDTSQSGVTPSDPKTSKKRTKSIHSGDSTNKSGPSKSRKKVRQSLLDLNNEFFKRGEQVRKLMYNAATLRQMIDNAQNSGWRVVPVSNPVTINWYKMMELVLDYVMRENWELTTGLSHDNVEVIEGTASFVDNHTLKVKQLDQENEITAITICIAPCAEYIFPESIQGATEYGITCDDFIRMDEPPGKTLVVGTLPEGLECAGIVAECRFPVIVVSKKPILEGYDTEISQMIVEDMKARGVIFYENTIVKSINKYEEDKLLVRFAAYEEDTMHEPPPHKEVFDTVLFAVGKKTLLSLLNLENAGIRYDSESQKIITDERDTTSVPNIYAIGDVAAFRPYGFEVSELAGKLLAKRSFNNGSQLMDYSVLPLAIHTPMEYAFVGISEDSALYRFGVDCIEVYKGFFKPLEFVLPPKTGKCFVKVIVFKPKDLVIGMHLFGPDSGEAIQGFAAAIKLGVTMSKLQSVVGVSGTRAQTILKFK